MLELISASELHLPGLPTTVAVAAVATIGYLIGRHATARDAPEEQLRRDMERALSETRQLEQIADDVLEATRSALAECRRFSHEIRSDAAQSPVRSAPNAFAAPSESSRSLV